MMKNAIFLDVEKKPIEVPEFNNVDEYDAFMMNVDYIYFHSEEARKEFSDLYNKFDGGNNPFNLLGVYSYDYETESWVHLWTKISAIRKLITDVTEVFVQSERLPLEGVDD